MMARMRMLSRSATNRPAPPSLAMPTGKLNLAAVPDPSAKPALPAVPATVVVVNCEAAKATLRTA